MDSKDSLMQLINRQIQVENTNVKEASEAAKKTNITVAKLLLNVIWRDSKKHTDILKGILKILKGKPQSENIWQYARSRAFIGEMLARKELEKHLEREKEMIELIKNETNKG